MFKKHSIKKRIQRDVDKEHKVEDKLLMLKDLLSENDDIVFHIIQLTEFPIHLVYGEDLVDIKFVKEFIYPALYRLDYESENFKEDFLKEFQVENITHEDARSLSLKVFESNIIFFLATDEIYALEIGNIPSRTPEEPSTETSLRGPRDGFIEDIGVNIALIRRRLKTETLQVKKYTVGKRSQTKIALLYLEDVINKEILKTVQERIAKINVDIINSAHQLEVLLADQPYSLFPTFDYSGRPDFAVECLNQGRFILIYDGQPTVSVAPINLSLLFKSPEDMNLNYIFVSMERLFRLASLFIAVFLPGLWVALTAFNPEQIPFNLLATVTVSRLGLPLSIPLEMLITLILFELFNEAGIRLPKPIGQTVAVLGGLIVGDAAIRAGLSSPSMLVIGSITFISSFTLVNQMLTTSATIFRFTVLLFATLFGIFGIVLSFLLIIAYFSRLTSFGLPYLSMLTPFRLGHITPAFLKKPATLYKKRSTALFPEDSTRKEE